jgi:hypothetical protein
MLSKTEVKAWVIRVWEPEPPNTVQIRRKGEEKDSEAVLMAQ